MFQGFLDVFKYLWDELHQIFFEYFSTNSVHFDLFFHLVSLDMFIEVCKFMEENQHAIVVGDL